MYKQAPSRLFQASVSHSAAQHPPVNPQALRRFIKSSPLPPRPRLFSYYLHTSTTVPTPTPTHYCIFLLEVAYLKMHVIPITFLVTV
jgi:hypothetical protein